MARHNNSWGIEVGANAIKAMRLARAGKGVELVDYDVLPFKQVLTTPDLNIDEAIQLGLDAFLAKHDVSKSNVVVSVPGHMAFARFAKLPPVEPKKIPDIVRFEAVQQIPFPIDQVEWDYQVFQQEDSPDVEVGIFAITKERVLTFLSNYRQVNLRVDALTLSPLAVYNAFAYENAEDPPESGTIFMDIGASSTDVIIVEHGGIWLRTLPIGGNNFTEALVKAFKLSFSKAEKLKKEAGTSKYARQIFQAMRPVFADLVQEMQRSLGYYQSMNRDAELTRLVGVGSTFRLPGLSKFLKQQLKMEVTRPDGYQRISVEGKQQANFAENALNMATAYGLALQGLGLESVSANILPQHILQQRLWRSKQPWIAAAAACVAVTSGLVGGRYFMEQANWTAVNEQTDRVVQPIASRGQGLVNEWTSITEKSDPRLQIENLRRILDYRDLWPKLLEDLSAASAALDPQPQTLEPNYDEIARIPASERRRFYIDSVNVNYQATTGQQTDGRTTVSSAEMISTSFTADNFFGSSATPPRFTVTVTGTTTHANAVQFISTRFIGWLKDHAKQPGRPYELIVDSSPIRRTWAVTGEAADTRGRGQGTGRNLPSLAPSPSTRIGGFGGFNQAGTTTAAAERPLLPTRPVNDAKSPGATGFEIQFAVQLVRPDQARRAEDEVGNSRTGPVETPAPAEPSPAAEAPAATTEEVPS